MAKLSEKRKKLSNEHSQCGNFVQKDLFILTYSGKKSIVTSGCCGRWKNQSREENMKKVVGFSVAQKIK